MNVPVTMPPPDAAELEADADTEVEAEDDADVLAALVDTDVELALEVTADVETEVDTEVDAAVVETTVVEPIPPTPAIPPAPPIPPPPVVTVATVATSPEPTVAVSVVDGHWSAGPEPTETVDELPLASLPPSPSSGKNEGSGVQATIPMMNMTNMMNRRRARFFIATPFSPFRGVSDI